MNRLSEEKSACLKHSANQKIDWYPFEDIIYGEDKGYVVPCIRDVCYEPIGHPDSLKDFIN